MGRIRVRMWEDALAAHRAGRVRVAEVRASDFIGPESGAQAHLGDQLIPRVLAGKKVRVFACGRRSRTRGPTCPTSRAPSPPSAPTTGRGGGRGSCRSNPPLTQREAFASVAAVGGVPMPAVGTISAACSAPSALAVPLIRALGQVLYQFERPFVIDASETTATFGIEPTPWDRVRPHDPRRVHLRRRSGRPGRGWHPRPNRHAERTP